jgi:endonuclease VIII
MPEGDTIFRTAATLRSWLVGREITAARCVLASVPAGILVGDTVTDAEARAKHLLIRFASGRVLHTHQRMTGSWHVYSASERWRRPAGQARVVLEAGDRVAVGFNVPVIELLAPRMDSVHPSLTGLGPDVLVDPFDVDVAVARIGAVPDREIGDVLLDQRVISGIGNIYRCESLFIGRVSPRRPVGVVAEREVRTVVEAAVRLMRASAGGASMGERWVYGRAARPCRRCGSRISSGRVGLAARTAYWCPRCQS